MKNLSLIVIALMALCACQAKYDLPAAQSNTAQPAMEVAAPAADSSKAVTPLVTFIELGAESCIPCKMMQPIMKAIRTEYAGLVDVIFHDLYKDREAGQKYGVRVMPTQVFLDAQGREFFRHEGYYPQEDIEKMLAEKIGLSKPQAGK